jgi:hypothetical protein
MTITVRVEGIEEPLLFPDGTSPDVIQATVKRTIATRAAPKSGVGPATMGAGGKPTGVADFVRGVRDPIDAGVQFAVRGANAIGLVPDSEVSRVEGINKEAQRDYIENWRGGTPESRFNVPRMAGAGLVAGAAGAPAKMAPTMFGRAMQAGRGGALAAGLTDVENPRDNADFFLKKGGQAAIGFGTGALMQPALEGLITGAGGIASWAANRAKGGAKFLSGGATEAAAAKIAADSLGTKGVDFQALPNALQKTLISDVQEAMTKYGGVDPKALARHADFAALGVETPPKAWVTRNPIDFGRYKNAEGTDAGDALKLIRADLDAKLFGRIAALSGDTGTAFESGLAAEKGLKRTNEDMQERVSGLYRAARESTGKDLEIPLQGLAQDYADIVSRYSDDVKRKLPLQAFEQFGLSTGKQTKMFTFEDADKLLKVINANTSNEPAVVNALRELRNAVKKSAMSVDPQGGPFAPAVAAAKERFDVLDAVPALQSVASGEFKPEAFLSQYIMRGSVRDVASMWSKIDSPEVKAAARSQIVDALKKAAGGAEDAPFRQGAFKNLLETPGMKEKLKIILGKDGLSQVELVQRASEAAIRIPSGARYNTSGSALELMNYGSKLPVIGPLVGEPMKKIAQDMEMKAVMQSGPQAFGQKAFDPFTEEWLRRARRSAGLLSPGLGGAMADQASR